MSNFLDSVGLTYLWGKIKATFVAKADISPVSTLDIDSTPTANSTNLVTSGGVYNAIPSTYAGSATAGGTADRTSAIPFGIVDSTSTSTKYTATVDGITELVDGTCVLLKNSVVTSAANFTININNLGAKPSYNNMATGNPTTPTAPTRDTTIFNINYTMLFIYSSTLVSGGAWICYRGYDANTNTVGYQLRTNSYILNASDGFRYYVILFTSADGTKWVPANSNKSNSATTAKTVVQTPINPFGEIVYCGNSTNYSAGSAVTATAIWQQYTVTLGYSFNRTGAALTLTTKKPVYIKCAPQTDGSAIIDSTTPYVQTLPTTDDGKIYILLGMAYSATAIELLMNHPVYYHKDGAIRVWTNAVETDTSSLAPKASPALTGTPTAPTAATGTNTTQIATTAFVQQELANSRGGTVDTELDANSTNPVENRVIFNELNESELAISAALNDLNSRTSLTEITWAELKELRDNSNLVPGKQYRITDYVTTTIQTDTHSAVHAFDILVMATSANKLNEAAFAIQHSGDMYFANSNLAAWELKYNIDNIQWSQRVGTLVVDENDGYKAMSIGTVDIDGETYILWDASEFEDDYDLTRLVSLTKEVGAKMLQYNPETGKIVEDGFTATIAEVIAEYTEPGKGTITWMKDEWGNECGYDFKNIQFKRWKVTDAKDRKGLDEKYMGVVNYTSKALSIKDEEDFIWCYTFSSDNTGGEQADYSLGNYDVHDNVFHEKSDGTLPNNVMFGRHNYCNSIGFDCYCNSWGNGCFRNSWGNGCFGNSCGYGCSENSCGYGCSENSWGQSCSDNSWGNWNQKNSWGNYCNHNSCGNSCQNNSLGNDCDYNSWGNSCNNNSLGNECNYNSWGNDCSNNSWGNQVTNSTVFDGVKYTRITTSKVQNVQVLNGLAGTYSSPLTLAFAANKSYTQVACKNTSGALKIYVPGELA